MSINDFISIGSICISILALIFSVITFFDERRRNRKEATIHAFDDLDGKIHTEEYGNLGELDEQQISNILQEHLHPQNPSLPKKLKDSRWEQITKGLALLEHFAVGVNTKVYDANTLNSMAGNYIIELYGKLLPIIEEKQKDSDDKHNEDKQNNNKHNYEELGKMKKKVDKIKRRKKRWEKIYGNFNLR